MVSADVLGTQNLPLKARQNSGLLSRYSQRPSKTELCVHQDVGEQLVPSTALNTVMKTFPSYVQKVWQILAPSNPKAMAFAPIVILGGGEAGAIFLVERIVPQLHFRYVMSKLIIIWL